MCSSDGKTAEVKVCPKCGKTHTVVWSPFNGGFYAVCQGCGIETPTAKSKEEAVDLWKQGVFEQS